jgi:protein-L-isoaspartate(D-aspartate) O-methyltransferase
MSYLDFITPLHRSTRRDYLERVNSHDKAECAEVACRFGQEYWDGPRQYGFGGYRYDGRWRPVAEALAKHYQLKSGQRVLDVGCGKAFLLYELTQVVPGIEVAGIDVSQYGLDNAKEEVRPFLRKASADKLLFPDKSFDLVISLNALHNLLNFELWAALTEIERVGRNGKYIVVESYRNEREKVNLLYWQLTCRAILRTDEWEWLYAKTGYTGDHSFIFFE